MEVFRFDQKITVNGLHGCPGIVPYQEIILSDCAFRAMGLWSHSVRGLVAAPNATEWPLSFRNQSPIPSADAPLP